MWKTIFERYEISDCGEIRNKDTKKLSKLPFGEFLHYKRYIAYKEDFEDLYKKYFSVDADDNVTLYICDTNYHAFENAIKERVALEELVKRFGR